MSTFPRLHGATRQPPPQATAWPVLPFGGDGIGVRPSTSPVMVRPRAIQPSERLSRHETQQQASAAMLPRRPATSAAGSTLGLTGAQVREGWTAVPRPGTTPHVSGGGSGLGGGMGGRAAERPSGGGVLLEVGGYGGGDEMDGGGVASSSFDATDPGEAVRLRRELHELQKALHATQAALVGKYRGRGDKFVGGAQFRTSGQKAKPAGGPGGSGMVPLPQPRRDCPECAALRTLLRRSQAEGESARDESSRMRGRIVESDAALDELRASLAQAVGGPTSAASDRDGRSPSSRAQLAATARVLCEELREADEEMSALMGAARTAAASSSVRAPPTAASSDGDGAAVRAELSAATSALAVALDRAAGAESALTGAREACARMRGEQEGMRAELERERSLRVAAQAAHSQAAREAAEGREATAAAERRALAAQQQQQQQARAAADEAQRGLRDASEAVEEARRERAEAEAAAQAQAQADAAKADAARRAAEEALAAAEAAHARRIAELTATLRNLDGEIEGLRRRLAAAEAAAGEGGEAERCARQRAELDAAEARAALEAAATREAAAADSAASAAAEAVDLRGALGTAREEGRRAAESGQREREERQRLEVAFGQLNESLEAARASAAAGAVAGAVMSKELRAADMLRGGFAAEAAEAAARHAEACARLEAGVARARAEGEAAAARREAAAEAVVAETARQLDTLRAQLREATAARAAAESESERTRRQLASEATERERSGVRLEQELDGARRSAEAAASRWKEQVEAARAAKERAVEEGRAAAAREARQSERAEALQQRWEEALQSSVRLCVVAPTVNVSLGGAPTSFKAPLPKEKIRETLEGQVLPNFTRAFLQAEEGVAPDGGAMDDYLKGVTVHMQGAIEKHLMAVFAEAGVR